MYGPSGRCPNTASGWAIHFLASYADVLRLATRGGKRDKPKNVCEGGYTFLCYFDVFKSLYLSQN